MTPLLKCPTCGLVARDVMGDRDRRPQTPPFGAIVLCECSAVNRVDSTGDAFLNSIGARKLHTLGGAEFDALPTSTRRALEAAIADLKRQGRWKGQPGDADPCTCGHERRQHLDPRWPCNVHCSCAGFTSERAQ